MKNTLSVSPKPLLHKLITTILIGFGCLAIGAAYFLFAHDKTIVILSCAVFACCLIRAYSLFAVISKGKYEAIDGVCIANTPNPLRRHRTVTVLDGNRVSHKLRLPKSARLKVGSVYRLYFSLGYDNSFVGERFESALSADGFLGYEEIDAVVADEK